MRGEAEEVLLVKGMEDGVDDRDWGATDIR